MNALRILTLLVGRVISALCLFVAAEAWFWIDSVDDTTRVVATLCCIGIALNLAWSWAEPLDMVRGPESGR